MTTQRFRLAPCAALCMLALTARAEVDLTNLSLEQLLAVKISTASKFLQTAAEAPSSVTVVTSRDIRAFGYRSLADILNGVRGFNVVTDHQYDYAGVRGFNRPGDFNSRVLVLVDGYRTNENVYDQAFIGGDFVLDLDLIDHIEIVRGASSSLYGSNAVFAVVNVITRRGADIDGIEMAVTPGSDGALGGRASAGKRLDNGAQAVISASEAYSRGQALDFPEPELASAANSYGHADAGRDFTRSSRLFARYSDGRWDVETAHAIRHKGIPSGYGGGILNDTAAQLTDQQGFVQVAYRDELGGGAELTTRAFFGYYDFIGDYPMLNAALQRIVDRNTAIGRWWGLESGWVVPLSASHKMLLGFEYQDNVNQDQRAYDLSPYASYLDDHASSNRVGAYLQDELQLDPSLQVSAGLRFDKYSGLAAEWSPRLGLVWIASARNVVKLIGSTAFRSPNVYETKYAQPGFQNGNPELRPERITTSEAVIEHFASPQTKFAGSLYSYRMSRLINQVSVPAGAIDVAQFQNGGTANGRGIEFEFERQWSSRARLRASAAASTVRDEAGILTNAPRHNAKIHLSLPLLHEWDVGMEVLGVSSRAAMNNSGVRRTLGGYGIANLTLLRPLSSKGAELSASIRNLFDRQYEEPTAADSAVPSRDAIVQDSRSFWLRLLVRY